MRRSQIIYEFDLLAEVVPIALAGILLNVAGRQIAEFYGGPFVDMTGTAFTAFLLGPWWAAAVAAATTIVNGNFFESYFPFGIVNIAGGLVWGYLARAGDLQNLLFAWNRGAIKRFLFWTVVLTLAGGLVCGLASTSVKLILYPELGRPFIYGSLYVSAHATLQQYFGTGTPDILTLAVVDVVRDLGDKLIVVPAAMLLVALTRIAPTFGQIWLDTTPKQRLQTDVASIFVFCVVYSASIFLAKMTRPIISIPGSAREISWLGNPMMVILLYAPLVVALFAFRLLTFRASDRMARRLHARWRRRREITRQLFEAADKRISFLPAFAIQALGTGVSIWPLRHAIDRVFGIPFVLGAIILALAGYLILARVYYAMLRRAMNMVETVRRWMRVGSEPAESAALVRLMQSLFGAYAHVPVPEVARRNKLIYTWGYLKHDKRGLLEEVLPGRLAHDFSEQVALLATIEAPRALSVPVLRDLSSLCHDTGTSLIALATTTPRVTDHDLIEGLRYLRKIGAEVILFDWTDLDLAVTTNALTGKPRESLRRGRARALSLLYRYDERFIMEELDRPKWLASRALASLNVVINRLPTASTVFDLGAGYGRHTMAASSAGHDVLAVDRKKVVCERLRHDLATLPPGSGKVAIIHSDFLDVSAESAGLADLIICTGALQHACNVEDLTNRLVHIAHLASQPAALIYIEMLFDMILDGLPPTDGRVNITHSEFEGLLREIFPDASWAVKRTFGPVRQVQTFGAGGRSFEPPARTIESTAAEYLIARHE